MLSPLQLASPHTLRRFSLESADGSSPSNVRTAVAPARCAAGLRSKERQVDRRFQPFSFLRILNQLGFFSSDCRKASLLCFHGTQAVTDKILKDSKIEMTKSSRGDVLPETPEANSGCSMTGISISIYYMAVVEWHREAGSEELHNPCAPYSEITVLAGYIDGKASHGAGCCCLLTTAIAQTLQQRCSRGTQATHTRST